MGVGRAVGDRDHHQNIGVVAVGAECLGAVQHPLVSFANRGHARAARVGARGWLGQSPGADEFASRQLRT